MDGKSSQEYLVTAGVPQDSSLGPTIFYYTLMSYMMMLSNITISAVDTTLYYKCDQASDLSQTTRSGF